MSASAPREPLATMTRESPAPAAPGAVFDTAPSDASATGGSTAGGGSPQPAACRPRGGAGAPPPAPLQPRRTAAAALAAEFEAEREAARAQRDPVCAVHLMAIHGWLLLVRGVRGDGVLGLALPALVALSLATLALYQMPRLRPWYMRHRLAFAIAVRLGLQAAAPVLQQAWLAPAAWLAPRGPLAAGAAGAFALLSGSRSLILLNSAWVRPLSPAPQVALSLAALALAAPQAGAACAGAGPRAAAAAGAARGARWLADLLASGAYGGVPPPQPQRLSSSCGGEASDLADCRRVSVFLQILVGVLLPTVLLLRQEADAAHAFLARRGLLPCGGGGGAVGGEGSGGGDQCGRPELAYPLGLLERAHSIFRAPPPSAWLHVGAALAAAWCAAGLLS